MDQNQPEDEVDVTNATQQTDDVDLSASTACFSSATAWSRAALRRSRLWMGASFSFIIFEFFVQALKSRQFHAMEGRRRSGS